MSVNMAKASTVAYRDVDSFQYLSECSSWLRFAVKIVAILTWSFIAASCMFISVS